MPDIGLVRRSALDGLIAAPARIGRPDGPAGVTVAELGTPAVARIAARAGRSDALAEAVRARYGLELPATPRRTSGGPLAFLWSGPDEWLAIAEDGRALAAELRAELGGLGAVSDQSHGYTVLRIRGPRAREALMKGVQIDLDPRIFRTGDTAVTVVAHIGAQITQIDDEPVFEVAISRSFAQSFWHWLTASAAEFGCAMTGRG